MLGSSRARSNLETRLFPVVGGEDPVCLPACGRRLAWMGLFLDSTVERRTPDPWELECGCAWGCTSSCSWTWTCGCGLDIELEELGLVGEAQAGR